MKEKYNVIPNGTIIHKSNEITLGVSNNLLVKFDI